MIKYSLFSYVLANMKRKSSRNGFTLMEILVTLVIVGVIGTIASQSLFSLLRGASKVEIIKELKQSGDFALSTMSVDIRNAKDIALLDVSTLPCDDTNTTVLGCASGGTSGQCLRITNITGSYSYYGCSAYVDPVFGNINRLTKGGTNYLTNDKVNVSSSCSTAFTCTDANPGNSPKLVNIRFTLVQSQTGANAAESASQTFDTEVSLRNK